MSTSKNIWIYMIRTTHYLKHHGYLTFTQLLLVGYGLQATYWYTGYYGFLTLAVLFYIGAVISTPLFKKLWNAI